MEEKIIALYERWKKGKAREDSGVYGIWFWFIIGVVYFLIFFSPILPFLLSEYPIFSFVAIHVLFYYLLKIVLPLLPYKPYKSERSRVLHEFILIVVIPFVTLGLMKIVEGSIWLGSVILAFVVLCSMNLPIFYHASSHWAAIKQIRPWSIVVAITFFMVSYLVAYKFFN